MMPSFLFLCAIVICGFGGTVLKGLFFQQSLRHIGLLGSQHIIK